MAKTAVFPGFSRVDGVVDYLTLPAHRYYNDDSRSFRKHVCRALAASEKVRFACYGLNCSSLPKGENR